MAASALSSRKWIVSLLFCYGVFSGVSLPGAYDDSCCEVPPTLSCPNAISIGPEYYHVKRTRKGGTSQSGEALGVRFTYDYIKRYCFYAGMQAFYGTGILKGHTGNEDKIRSRLSDAMVEGALGYTFQMKCYPYLSFTPYAGYGYFREVNDFTSPSPLPIKLTTYYPYIPFGFLSSATLNSCLTIGFNARFRSPWDVKCKVTDDPEFQKIRQMINERIQFRLELPLTYTGGIYWCFLQAALVPFYERRLYGSRENYPFDFYETKYSIYGLNLQLLFRF